MAKARERCLIVRPNNGKTRVVKTRRGQLLTKMGQGVARLFSQKKKNNQMRKDTITLKRIPKRRGKAKTSSMKSGNTSAKGKGQITSPRNVKT